MLLKEILLMAFYMKRKIMNPRTVKIMNDESRIIGYCIECDSPITDDMDAYYCDNEGNLLCSHECILEYFCITQMEV
jgi:hypothetical protein